MKYLYILGTVLFTVYGQLILKWRIADYGALPEPVGEKVVFLLRLLADVYILSGFMAAFMASLFWMAAMTKFDLSYAYPFVSLSFVLVLAFSVFLFQEPFTYHKMVGMAFIVLGVLISSKSG